MRVKAAVLFDTSQDMVIENIVLDDPRDREVLLRIRAAGVCHSDLSVARGHGTASLPLVLGHEGAAVVERVGAGVSRVTPGDHVVLSWSPACGHCFYCRESVPVQCEVNARAAGSGTLWDGTSRLHSETRGVINHFASQSSYAEFAVMPEAGCLPIDKDIPFEIAAIVGCAVTTGFGAVVNDARVQPGQSVAIWGIGGVGISAILGAVTSGAERIIAVDPNARKEAVSRQFGATHFINPSATDDLPAAVRALTQGRGADVTLECIGNPTAFQQAFLSTRPAGTLVSVGTPPRGVDFTIPGARAFPMLQKRIIGSYYGGSVPERDFRRLFDLYKSGRLDLEAIVARTIKLEAINDAMRDLEKGIDKRIVVTFDP